LFYANSITCAFGVEQVSIRIVSCGGALKSTHIKGVVGGSEGLVGSAFGIGPDSNDGHGHDVG
jgi:hypothetical protein